MFASALITLREGLEAALIVGVVLAYLAKIGRPDRRSAVWSGVVAALIASIALAVALQALGAKFEGRAEEIFEGATMFLAVAVLTYMIFWMRHQGHRLRGALEQDVQAAVSGGQTESKTRGRGLEPRPREPKSLVLPLDDPRMIREHPTGCSFFCTTILAQPGLVGKSNGRLVSW